MEKLAAMTPGFFSGADLANLINGSGAARHAPRAEWWPSDFNEAIERLIAGWKRKNRVLNETERRVVAHHELGHALWPWPCPQRPGAQDLDHPRGVAALGYTLPAPDEDRFIMTRESWRTGWRCCSAARRRGRDLRQPLDRSRQRPVQGSPRSRAAW